MMNKFTLFKKMPVILAVAVMSLALAGCGRKAAAEETAAPAETQIQETAEESRGETEESQGLQEAADTVRIGSMKGPTSMGLVYLMHQAGKGETQYDYSFTMETAADTLLPMLVKGELDIALLPANAASILYAKTEGGIAVIDINTLGVLYLVSADSSITGVEDLKGKTVYLTGKGTTPDFALQYLLTQNGLSVDDVKLEYKSEATEVAALLAENPESLGLLPQPFVTAACIQNPELKEVLDITKEWEAVSGENGSSLVTGVTVVRKEFLQQKPEIVADFLAEHKVSTEYANMEVEDAAELVADYGIIEKAQIAVKAMPQCNIVYIDGAEMQKALSGYLQVLYEMNPEAVGGSLPAEDFYYK